MNYFIQFFKLLTQPEKFFRNTEKDLKKAKFFLLKTSILGTGTSFLAGHISESIQPSYLALKSLTVGLMVPIISLITSGLIHFML